MPIEIDNKLNKDVDDNGRKEMRKKKKVIPAANVLTSGLTQSELLSNVKDTGVIPSSTITVDVVDITSTLKEARSPTTTTTTTADDKEEHDDNKKQKKDDDDKHFKEIYSIAVGPITWGKTKLGGDMLFMEESIYVFQSKSDKLNKTLWRCQRRDKKCRAVVYTDSTTANYLGNNGVDHNHPTDLLSVKKHRLVNDLKRKGEDLTVNIPAAVDQGIANLGLNDEDMVNFPRPKTMARAVYRHRANMFPPLPKGQTFEIPKQFSQTKRNESFVLYDGYKKKYDGRLLLFSTNELLQQLCQTELILVDGTFASVPTGFEQLVVIMGTINDEGVPLAWALTSNRKQPTYDKIWSEIISWSLKKPSPMKVKRFILNFETAQRNSIEQHFVGAEVTGCWFHFCKALYKNIRQLGLITSYKDNAAIRTWLRSFMSLPLVDNDIFPYAVEYLQRHIPTGSDQCREFLRYFESQWLVSVPRQYWHVGNLIPRSNNWIEGYNNRIGIRFGNHPNIWLFLYHLLIEEQIIEQRVQQLVVGKIQRSGSAHAPQNDTISHSITNLNRKYINGKLDIEKYLKACTFLVGNADVGSANANKMVSSTATTVCPTTTPPKKKKLATKISTAGPTTKTLSFN
ncbi:unnamed protein product [Rotaria sordida]|uniref:FLYWCH-type domain-containing protein n=1 Tax=Rotaria sordida TaxID=392033 RepID=A0A816C4L6_9BILA|nr:unnamed protein product [Rotaria sordida]CAF1619345.1 unnamed protein product [Rotaria sordida]